MQMNAEFKEEQIGTPFVWVGALEGRGRGGGGGKRGSNPKNTRDVQYFFFSTLLGVNTLLLAGKSPNIRSYTV